MNATYVMNLTDATYVMNAMNAMNVTNATEETNTRSKVQVHCFQKGLQTDDATGSRGFEALAGAGSGETEVVGDTESRSET